jgi:hypothetical protein
MSTERLCEKIRSKFKTDAAFGLAMGWVPQKVCKLTNGNYIPKIGEAARMSRVLDISLDELASFFSE